MKNFLEYMKCGGKSHYQEGGSFKKHRMFEPPNFTQYVMAETEEDHNFYQSQGYLHEDELPTANMGMNISDAFKKQSDAELKQLAKDITGKKFEGPSAPQNMDTDTYGKAKIDFFVGHLSSTTDKALSQKAKDIAYQNLQQVEATGLPMANYGGSFFTNYHDLGTFGFNPGMNNEQAWYNAADAGFTGGDFLSSVYGGVLDVAERINDSLNSKKARKREYYTKSAEELAAEGKQGVDYDPKKYRLFGQASEYSIKDMFDASKRIERREGLQDARNLQKLGRNLQREAEQEKRQILRDNSSFIKSIFNEEERTKRQGYTDAFADVKDQRVNWRKSYTVQPQGTIAYSDLQRMGLNMYKYGGSMKNQFGGKVDKNKFMYHDGGAAHNAKYGPNHTTHPVTTIGNPQPGFMPPNPFVNTVSPYDYFGVEPGWSYGRRIQSNPGRSYDDMYMSGNYGYYDPSGGIGATMGSVRNNIFIDPRDAFRSGYFNPAIRQGYFLNEPITGYEPPEVTQQLTQTTTQTGTGSGKPSGKPSGKGAGTATASTDYYDDSDLYIPFSNKTRTIDSRGNVVDQGSVAVNQGTPTPTGGGGFGFPAGYYDIDMGPYGGSGRGLVGFDPNRLERADFDKRRGLFGRRQRTRLVFGPQGQPVAVPDTATQEGTPSPSGPYANPNLLPPPAVTPVISNEVTPIEEDVYMLMQNPYISKEAKKRYMGIESLPMSNRALRRIQRAERRDNRGRRRGTIMDDAADVPTRRGQENLTDIRSRYEIVNGERKEFNLGGLTTGEEWRFNSALDVAKDTLLGKDGAIANFIQKARMAKELSDANKMAQRNEDVMGSADFNFIEMMRDPGFGQTGQYLGVVGDPRAQVPTQYGMTAYRPEARRRYGGEYALGGSYELSNDEIAQILAAGGQIEYL